MLYRKGRIAINIGIKKIEIGTVYPLTQEVVDVISIMLDNTD